MTDIIDQIDAAICCQHCHEPYGASASPDFCSPECQAAWHSTGTEPLIGYREPTDHPAYVDNQVEVRSAETTPRAPSRRDNGGVSRVTGIWIDDVAVWQPLGHTDTNEPVVLGFDPAGGSMVAAWSRGPYIHVVPVMDSFREQIQLSVPGNWDHHEVIARMLRALRSQGIVAFQGLAAALTPAAAAMRALADSLPTAAEMADCPMQHEIEARRHRNTGPAAARRAPRRIDPRRNR